LPQVFSKRVFSFLPPRLIFNCRLCLTFHFCSSFPMFVFFLGFFKEESFGLRSSSPFVPPHCPRQDHCLFYSISYLPQKADFDLGLFFFPWPLPRKCYSPTLFSWSHATPSFTFFFSFFCLFFVVFAVFIRHPGFASFPLVASYLPFSIFLMTPTFSFFSPVQFFSPFFLSHSFAGFFHCF